MVKPEDGGTRQRVVERKTEIIPNRSATTSQPDCMKLLNQPFNLDIAPPDPVSRQENHSNNAAVALSCGGATAWSGRLAER